MEAKKFYILKIQCFQKGKLFFHLFAKDVFGKLSRLDKAPQGTAPINQHEGVSQKSAATGPSSLKER